MSQKKIEAWLSSIYYSPQGYWKGISAIKKLTAKAKVSEDVARSWLERQALWQIYLPPPRRIPRPKFDVSVPNEVHQADLLFLPHDRPGRGRKLYKYALSPWLMLQAATRKPSHWPQRKPKRLPQLSLASTHEGLYDGQNFSRLTLAESLWEQQASY